MIEVGPPRGITAIGDDGDHALTFRIAYFVHVAVAVHVGAQNRAVGTGAHRHRGMVTGPLCGLTTELPRACGMHEPGDPGHGEQDAPHHKEQSAEGDSPLRPRA